MQRRSFIGGIIAGLAALIGIKPKHPLHDEVARYAPGLTAEQIQKAIDDGILKFERPKFMGVAIEWEERFSDHPELVYKTNADVTTPLHPETA